MSGRGEGTNKSWYSKPVGMSLRREDQKIWVEVDIQLYGPDYNALPNPHGIYFLFHLDELEPGKYEVEVWPEYEWIGNFMDEAIPVSQIHRRTVNVTE